MSGPSVNGKITVYVKLPGIFSAYRPDPSSHTAFPVKIDRGSTLADLVATLGMPAGLAELFFVNQRRCTPAEVLVNGAAIEIFPSLTQQ